MVVDDRSDDGRVCKERFVLAGDDTSDFWPITDGVSVNSALSRTDSFRFGGGVTSDGDSMAGRGILNFALAMNVLARCQQVFRSSSRGLLTIPCPSRSARSNYRHATLPTVVK